RVSRNTRSWSTPPWRRSSPPSFSPASSRCGNSSTRTSPPATTANSALKRDHPFPAFPHPHHARHPASEAAVVRRPRPLRSGRPGERAHPPPAGNRGNGRLHFRRAGSHRDRLRNPQGQEDLLQEEVLPRIHHREHAP